MSRRVLREFSRSVGYSNLEVETVMGIVYSWASKHTGFLSFTTKQKNSRP